MAHVTPFYQHISPGSRLGDLASPSYPYHDDDQCAVGQEVKASDQWQYYRDEPADQRAHCTICAALASSEPAASLVDMHSKRSG